MAESRYGAVQQNSFNTPVATSMNSSGSSAGSSSSMTNQSGSSSTNTTTASQNMDQQSFKALQELISVLQGGGTADMQRANAQRQQEIEANRVARGGYSKEAGFLDAQGAMAQQLRTVLEKLVPTITRAAEGAGTSQNSMRALLTQDAANRAAESSAALGLNAATAYGGLQAQFGSILEKLTQGDDPATKALLDALNIAKGAMTNSQQQSHTTSQGTSSTNSAQQSTQNQTQNQVRGPVSVSAPAPAEPGIYGFSVTPNELQNEGLAWTDPYSF